MNGRYVMVKVDAEWLRNDEEWFVIRYLFLTDRAAEKSLMNEAAEKTVFYEYELTLAITSVRFCSCSIDRC